MWEIVRRRGGWHLRFVGRNGRVIVSSGAQLYTRKAGAMRAWGAILRAPVGHGEGAER